MARVEGYAKCFPRGKVEAPCHYEKYLAKVYQNSYVIVKELKLFL